MTNKLSRRSFLSTTTATAVALSAPFVFTGGRARASETLIVGDMGGSFNEGFKYGLYDDFEKDFGISISATTMQPDPLPSTKWPLIPKQTCLTSA
ncbi:hypothetical protein MWU54_11555 [Marivita sp. S6314]|uniref:hypothetical protein n=1 Tax=Marivita sp. S6314 TaxID=2926406 RepID=UPI001FF1D061|nr:hypothetical protein [Marivita sp. S6314]MCK0150663.1 hypothetical protein [Marivita sp. S6314]